MPLCFHCKYYPLDDDSPTDGTCRCHPPQVGDLLEEGTLHEFRWFGEYPKVRAHDWCGEFEPEQRNSEFAATYLVTPSDPCGVDLLDDAQVGNTESTPHDATWASWASWAAHAAQPSSCLNLATTGRLHPRRSQ